MGGMNPWMRCLALLAAGAAVFLPAAAGTAIDHTGPAGAAIPFPGTAGAAIDRPAGAAFPLSLAGGAGTAISGAPAAAVSGTWVATGPPGGDVVALAAAPGQPGTLYAASAYGFVLRSEDGASTWTRGGRVAPGLDAGLPGFNRIRQLAVDPSAAATVYAASSEGLFRSTDSAASWTMLPAGKIEVEAVAVAPSNPAVLYAITFGGLLRSRNHGASFRPIGRGQLPFSLSGLAVDPSDPGKVYVGSDHGLFRSTDGGIHWTAAGGASAPGGLVAEILVLPDGSVLAVADFPSGGVVLSGDGGITWRNAFRGLPSIPGSPLSPTAVVRSGNGSFYAYYPDTGEVFRSNRRLRRWLPVTSLGPLAPPRIAFPVLSMAADAGADVVYAGLAELGVLRSTAGGSWSLANDGLALHEVQQVVAAPASGGSSPTVLLLARPDRAPAYAAEQLLVSTVPGVTTALGWSEVPGLDGIAGRIAFDPVSQIIYSLSDFGIRRSADFQTWTLSDSGLGTANVVDLAVATGPTGHLFAMAAGPAAICGTSPCHPLTAFASTDGGLSWTARGSTSDADEPSAPPGPFRGQLVLDPVAPATLYLLAAGLHKSADGGVSFSTLPLPGFAAALAIDSTAPATLYAAVRPGAAALLWKSLDGGATWSPAAQGLPAAAQVASLVLDPVRPSLLYLATDQGVFATGDGAATWAPLSQGLEGITVLSLAVWFKGGAPTGTASPVLAGTEGAGVFILQPVS
jgi:photosystem II stability/assembly factor-like uncharacterized protein